MESNTDRQPTDERPDYLRSRVTNGRDLLPGVDGRSLWIRRLRDVMSAHIADLGGDDAISEAQRSIVRRIGTMTVAIEKLEAKFAQDGEASDRGLDLHQRMAGNLRRLLEAIGLERRSKDITPTLDQYLASRGR